MVEWKSLIWTRQVRKIERSRIGRGPATRTMEISRILALSLLMWGLSSVSSERAHEFWLEPLQSMIAPGERFEANIKVGQKLEGDIYSYLPFRFLKFGFVDGDAIRPIRSTIGDRPAVAETIAAPGMVRLVYLSAPNFAKFATKEGLDGAVDRHKSRNLTRTNFKEACTCAAKALVRVGGGDVVDTPVGLPVELVAETNPFTAPTPNPSSSVYCGKVSPRQAHRYRCSCVDQTIRSPWRDCEPTVMDGSLFPAPLAFT
jgi:hypothetical protein